MINIEEFNARLKSIKEDDCIIYSMKHIYDCELVYRKLKGFYKSLIGNIPFTESNKKWMEVINESLKDFNPKNKYSYKQLEFSKRSILLCMELIEAY